MLDLISQICIFIFGVSSIFLLGRREHWRRWGFILGAIGQPFWFYTAWAHQQWGVLFVSFFYALAWAQGIWNFWIKEDPSTSSGSPS